MSFGNNVRMNEIQNKISQKIEEMNLKSMGDSD